MGYVDLTVQVMNISPNATKEDLISFFSYCGTVQEIKLERDADRTQKAKVTFGQPYAFETALLLNNAVVIDRRVRILPLGMKEIPISSSEPEKQQNMQRNRSEGYISISPFDGMMREDVVIAKAKDLALNTGRILTQQAGSALVTAERMANEIGSNIINNSEFLLKGAVWMSGVLDKASKSLADLGNKTK